MNLKPNEFWNLTYAEFTQMVEGYQEREHKRHEELMFTAWRTAAWARTDYKLPQWSEVEKQFNHSIQAPKKQTPEQMFAMVKVLNAAFGGTVVEV